MSIVSKIFETICCLIGLYCYFRLKQLELKLLVGLLVITVCNEVGVIEFIKAHYQAVEQLGLKSLAYNVFSLVDLPIWLYIFYKIFYPKINGWFMISIGALLYCSYGIDMLYYHSIYQFHVESLRYYEAVILALSLIYLIAMLRKDYYPLFSSYSFWLVAACLLFHAISLINFAAVPYHKVIPNYPFRLIQAISNFLYYSCIAIALIVASLPNQWNKQLFQPS